MKLEFNLTEKQVQEMAKSLYLCLPDIKEYVETHKEEYEQFLNEEEQKEKTKKYEKFQTKNTSDKNCNKQTKYNTDSYTIWQQYKDYTVCTVKINKKGL